VKKYKVTPGGMIRDTETGRDIPRSLSNDHYQAFLEWEAAGNTPDPEFTELELLEQAKAAKHAEIEAAYMEAESAPVTVGLFSYPGGEAAAVELDRIIRAAGLLEVPECDVQDIDGIDRTLTVAAAKAVLKAMITALRPLTKARRKKLRDIKVAANEAEVEAITW
jgi:hypothetical protein